ncbi:unnamed protein product [Dicrocoelium dendriticum]|nr:unnamed protein product [Dicrocoelium dendriticum]
MMQRLLTWPLMAETNYTGSRNQYGFRETQLSTKRQAAMLKRFSGSNVSPDDVTREKISEIYSWQRMARHRLRLYKQSANI